MIYEHLYGSSVLSKLKSLVCMSWTVRYKD